MNKAKLLEKCGFIEVQPIEMYRDIFKLGEHFIQENGEPSGLYKTNPIMVGHNGKFPITRIMFEDEFERLLEDAKEWKWAFMSGLTYWGKRNISEAQSKMFAMIFDLDGIGSAKLGTFIDGARHDMYPLPNYIVLSGNGVHLYYVFENPISLYPNTKLELKRLKFALTDVIWNERTSIANPQYQGINQSYRVPGTRTKKEGVTARAFRISEHPVTIDYLNSFVEPEFAVDTSRMFKESTYTLDEARALFPDWYRRRILNKEPPKTWKTGRHVYDWWKTKIFEQGAYGHRYFCIMALAIYAIKCGVDEEELRSDARAFANMLNAIYPEEAFTDSDVESALECYDARYITFPREDISKLTGIQIPENKRNHRDRYTHLQADTWTVGGETIRNPCKENREAALEKARREGRITGRPKGSGTEQQRVIDYYREHPDDSIRKAARELGINKNTVQKWRPR